MSGVGASQLLRVVASVAVAFLGGSFAIGLMTSSISERITLLKK
ncbi:hypothetical protein OROGR_018420 [Orobanche gracilis]